MTRNYLAVCEAAARKAGTVLRDMLGTTGVRHKKNPFDLVTEADIAAQEAIERIVLDAFPEHGFLGEEGDPAGKNDGTSEFRWIVDPLDGTTNYVHGVPVFATSIALARSGELLCGVVYHPMAEEFYTAERGRGAFLNGHPIRTSSYRTLGESLVAVSFPTMTKNDSPDLRAFLRSVPVCQAIRRTGSTALNLAYVAAGRFEATWAFQCHPWDVAAGALLVEEAGGTVTAPDGTPLALDGDPVPICAVANAPLQREVLQLLGGA